MNASYHLETNQDEEVRKNRRTDQASFGIEIERVIGNARTPAQSHKIIVVFLSFSTRHLTWRFY